MTLLPELPLTRASALSGSIEGGGNGVASLDPFVYRSPRWCERCARLETFVEVFECEAGRLGYCWGCGDEKVIPFTRVTEAA